MLQNGTRIPRTFWQENYWGDGSYRMATYMTWYDSSNRVVRTQSVWGSLRLGGTPVSSCALGATSNISTYNS
jgi:hypothetical protein